MTQITPPPSDDDLPDERELAALYARLPKVEPDASLDAAVLAAAARATPAKHRPRWPVALASAAVLVLAVGVAWQVREIPPASSALPTAAAPAPVAAPVAAPAPVAPAAPVAQEARSFADKSAPTEELRGANSTVGADLSAKPLPRAQIHRLATPAPAPMAAATPMPAAAPPEPVAPPAPSAPEAPVVSAAPAPAQPQAGMVQPAPSGLLRQNSPVPTSAGMLRQKSLAPASDAAYVPAGLAPDDRVGEIRRLLGRGERAQALRELRDLRQRYPHYDLPQDLRDLNP